MSNTTTKIKKESQEKNIVFLLPLLYEANKIISKKWKKKQRIKNKFFVFYKTNDREKKRKFLRFYKAIYVSTLFRIPLQSNKLQWILY